MELYIPATNKLPDLRGEFIRGWDDGRGIDAGRFFFIFKAEMEKKHHPFFPHHG
nr:hypothetical protein [Escherichia coli]